jgi:hypothetical protein
VLGATGVASVKLPARSPNWNAYAERFVLIKESCLERLILFGESSVRRAAAEFTVHYHRERNHQGLNNKLICPDPKSLREGSEVKRRERLGGLLLLQNRCLIDGRSTQIRDGCANAPARSEQSGILCSVRVGLGIGSDRARTDM